ncbi:hypothetical protein C8Q77DRAFT_1218511 [Trametes polyzona]|nr:hypothetical protein C8Q77DRAFT_1218511 [Trametes polyzona]
MTVPLPSLESLAHRARLAALISELRPTHFRAPLTRLEAHRIPTLWSLYRGIMRDAPSETIRAHMREFFHTRRNIREQGAVTRALKIAHRRWDVFRKARDGDERAEAICMRYHRMIRNAALQDEADAVYQAELEWLERQRTRPVLTGAYLKPTLFNGPLPRLRPQPLHITGMIVARRKARERRTARHEMLREQTQLVEVERSFELALEKNVKEAPFERAFADNLGSWRGPINDDLKELGKSFEREKKRARTPYPPELLEQIKAARRAKVENKTRERERERRGEMTKRLLRQMRQTPPAHRLALMSPRERRLDAIARGASEVGYVGQVKRELGFKLRDPDAWEVELGRPENREMLDRMAQEIEEENARRRSKPLDENTDNAEPLS